MSQIRNVLTKTFTASTPSSADGRITNFSPDMLGFYVENVESTPAVITKAMLSHLFLTVNLKNSKGDNVVIINNCPLDVVADLSDYEGGWSVNSADKVGAFGLDLGNIILTGTDELYVSISADSSVTDIKVVIFANDRINGKERIYHYDYVGGSASQTYHFINALSAFAQIASPDPTKNIETYDFFGNNTIDEVSAVSLGAILGKAENFDNFGLVWSDKTMFSQNLGIKCASSNEKFLVRCVFFDEKRIGNNQSEVTDVKGFVEDIKVTNSVKYKCLVSYFG